MKKITLLIALLTATVTFAQEPIIWQQGTTGAAASRTIEVGDTVTWIWGNNSSHDIASTDPDAPSDFGTPLSGTGMMGFEYQYTFTEPGVIDYFCTPHINSMFGTITVNEILSVEDRFILNLKAFPNPVTDDVFTLSSAVPVDRYAIHDILGNKLVEQAANGTETQINLSAFSSGVYLVSVTSGDISTTLKLVKR